MVGGSIELEATRPSMLENTRVTSSESEVDVQVARRRSLRHVLLNEAVIIACLAQSDRASDSYLVRSASERRRCNLKAASSTLAVG